MNSTNLKHGDFVYKPHQDTAVRIVCVDDTDGTLSLAGINGRGEIGKYTLDGRHLYWQTSNPALIKATNKTKKLLENLYKTEFDPVPNNNNHFNNLYVKRCLTEFRYKTVPCIGYETYRDGAKALNYTDDISEFDITLISEYDDVNNIFKSRKGQGFTNVIPVDLQTLKPVKIAI